jgi:hypothetical protein
VPKEAAEYKLQNGQSVIVEAEVPEDYGEEKVSLFGGRRDNGEPPSLSAALDRVMPALGEVFTKITSLNFKPDDIELKVGIKFVGEAGVVIARASTEANLVVTLKWNSGKAGEKA